MAQLGWVEGRSVVIDCIPTGISLEEVTNHAAELVIRRPDVLAASPTYYVRALKRATTSIPIVMVSTPDPVQSGLVTNLPRPEANVTGVAQSGVDLVGKRMQLVSEMLPRFARLAIIWSTGVDTIYREQIERDATAAAKILGVSLQAFMAAVPEDFDDVFGRLAAQQFDAAYVVPGPVSYANQARIAELGRRHRLPTLGDHPIFARNGFLITYGEDPNRAIARAAEYVDKILRGTKPGELPVEQPSKFELVINFNTVKALGLTIPPSLLARADEVIE
jgi:putative ABC transport system substrate-binding protein